MFESDEVDDDYFTPGAKTSLASIFKKPVTGENSDNETLKYTPPVPKPPQHQEDPQKLYENIFSCIIDAYLWLDNVYTSKGKLGCAVVKHNAAKSFHSILLYDSKRATVSSAIATNTLQVTVKGNDVISYYDQYGKYWYLRGTDVDVTKLINALKACNVNITLINEEDNALPRQSEASKDAKDTNKKVIESDTDSSINKKTKASILNRMANMGQSVLPPRASTNIPSSDSDTNEGQIIAVRHKPVKHVAKKTASEHPTQDAKAIVAIPQTEDSKTSSTVDNKLQVQTSTSTPILSTSGHELSCLFTEQRINSSELRINMNRITDKVDCILDKVNNLDKDKNEGSNINTMILQKLLTEYESKIKNYEELLQKELNKNNVPTQVTSTEVLEREVLFAELNNKIIELEISVKQKELNKNNVPTQVTSTEMLEREVLFAELNNKIIELEISVKQKELNKNNVPTQVTSTEVLEREVLFAELNNKIIELEISVKQKELNKNNVPTQVTSTEMLEREVLFAELNNKIIELEISVKQKELNKNNVPTQVTSTEMLEREVLFAELNNKIIELEISIKQKELNKNNVPTQVTSTEMLEREVLFAELNNKIIELEISIKQKDCEISVLNNEIEALKEANSQMQDELHAKEQNCTMHNKRLSKVTAENEELVKCHNNQLEHTIKNIMNETFRAIEINFDNNETYSGERTINIVGTVIKKVTIESLKDAK